MPVCSTLPCITFASWWSALVISPVNTSTCLAILSCTAVLFCLPCPLSRALDRCASLEHRACTRPAQADTPGGWPATVAAMLRCLSLLCLASMLAAALPVVMTCAAVPFPERSAHSLHRLLSLCIVSAPGRGRSSSGSAFEFQIPSDRLPVQQRAGVVYTQSLLVVVCGLVLHWCVTDAENAFPRRKQGRLTTGQRLSSTLTESCVCWLLHL
jgi:hypothetical protein